MPKFVAPVAAPTAGFHFTERVIEALRERTIQTCEITLMWAWDVQPVRVEARGRS